MSFLWTYLNVIVSPSQVYYSKDNYKFDNISSIFVMSMKVTAPEDLFTSTVGN